MLTTTLSKITCLAVGVVMAILCPTALFSTACGQSIEELESTKSEVGVGLEKCFELLRFRRPVLVTHAGDGSDRIFVVEQNGRILTFENGPSPSKTELFLDISSLVSRKGNEEGLLGLAFHPDYKSNGQFFVSYSSIEQNRLSVIARYTVKADNANQADPDSAEVILTLPTGIYIFLLAMAVLKTILTSTAKTLKRGWGQFYESTSTIRTTGKLIRFPRTIRFSTQRKTKTQTWPLKSGRTVSETFGVSLLTEQQGNYGLPTLGRIRSKK